MKANIKYFRDVLESTIIPEELSQEEAMPLYHKLYQAVEAIIPSRLFRYRECSEMHLDAFDRDLIYASSADRFNDPYDCLLRFDKNFLFESINRGASKEAILELRDYLLQGNPMPEWLNRLYGERSELLRDAIIKSSDDEIDANNRQFALSRSEFDSNVEALFADAVNFFRQNSHVACFSETVKSVTMWSHYAKSHTGFVLEYDLRNLTIKCDRCENKDRCADRIIATLYPMLYTKKRYDATSFVDYYLGKSFSLTPTMEDTLFFKKAALYKSQQWAYEKEWRLFMNKVGGAVGLSCLTVEIKPKAIYYGSSISSVNKKILRALAKEKGIKEYQMYVDLQSEEYSVRYRKV